MKMTDLELFRILWLIHQLEDADSPIDGSWHITAALWQLHYAEAIRREFMQPSYGSAEGLMPMRGAWLQSEIERLESETGDQYVRIYATKILFTSCTSPRRSSSPPL